MSRDQRLGGGERALLEEARAIAQRSWAPPSERSGALVVTRDGARYPGVAIRLRSAAGLSACAEQVALSAARGASTSPIETIALWVPQLAGDHPCGKCLQIWLELAPTAHFLLQRGDQKPRLLHLDEQLPDAFTRFDARLERGSSD